MKVSEFFWLNNEPMMEQILKQGKEAHMEILDPVIASAPDKTYLITETAQKVIDRIKIEKLDFKLLQDVPDGSYQSLQQRNKDTLHKWIKFDDWIYAAVLDRNKVEKGDYVGYHTYRLNTIPGILSDSKDYTKEFILNFMKEYVFLYLSDIVVDFLEPNRSRGTRKQGKIKNNTKSGITIVDSKWNHIIMRTEGFAVSGHFALRRHGKGFKKARLTYIEEYMKKGYKRGVSR